MLLKKLFPVYAPYFVQKPIRIFAIVATIRLPSDNQSAK